VRRDRKPDSVAELSVGEGFVRGTYCEFRDEFGRHVRVPEEVEKSALAGLPLVEVSTTGRYESALRHLSSPMGTQYVQ